MNLCIEKLDKIAEEIWTLEKIIRSESSDPRELPLFDELREVSISLSEIYNEFGYLKLIEK